MSTLTPDYYVVITNTPNFYIVGELAPTRNYIPGSSYIILVDPLVVRVKDDKLAIEEFAAAEGEVTINIRNHAAVGKLKKSLYAPILQYRQIKAEGLTA